jgi:ABC-type transport system involved in cytochrome c biogenesis permease component
MFGALAGALTLERGNIVGSSIVIPMCLPALILGMLAIQSHKSEEVFFYIFLLAAFLFFSIPILIASCLGAIRLHFE